MKRKHRPAVRGPQLELANGDLPKLAPGRTPRMRYVEPPTKRQGSPFFAVRVPSNVLRAFRRKCDVRKVSPQFAVRAFMAKYAGVKLEVADGNG